MFFPIYVVPPERPTVTIVQMAPVDASLEATFAERAKANGWSASQAAWISKLGAAVLDGKTDRSPAALDAAYKEAGRKLSAGYFDNALNEGKSRLVAFLTVIDLEKQVAQRAGQAAPAYSEEALKAAYLVLARAAENGAATQDQLDTAFAALRAAKPE